MAVRLIYTQDSWTDWLSCTVRPATGGQNGLAAQRSIGPALGVQNGCPAYLDLSHAGKNGFAAK